MPNKAHSLTTLTEEQTAANWQWVLTSSTLLNMPNTVKTFHWGLLDEHANQLAQKPSMREVIQYVLERPHQRLGIQFEHYLACAIELCSGVNHWHRNVQIANQKGRYQQTLGELDFLLQLGDTKSTQWCHMESAVKFYLADCATPEALAQMHHWVGPNRKDRLDLKVNRLLTHQLRLTDTDACRSQLNLDATTIDKRLLVKGRLYLPRDWQHYGEDTLRKHLPKEVNPEVELGWWCTLSALQQALQNHRLQHSGHWLIINRHAWMGMPACFTALPNDSYGGTRQSAALAPRIGPTQGPPFEQLASIDEQTSQDRIRTWLDHLALTMRDAKRPIQVMFWPKKNPALTHSPRVQRIFITPDHWPTAF